VTLLLVAALVCVPVLGRDLSVRLSPGAAEAQTVAATFSYIYDDNGNMVSRTDGTHSDTFSYDAENRLVATDVQIGPTAGSVTHSYDAEGIRTSRTENGRTTRYTVDKNRELAQVLVEIDERGTVATYTHGLDLLSQTRPSGGTRFYLYDGLGSTRQLTDAAGAVTDTYTYDAFGNVLAASGSTANVYLYRGEQLDPNVGFYYLRARYYAPAIGRFLTMDPFAGSVFDPASLHRYLYAGADPVNAHDPTGEFTLNDLLIAGAILGVFAGLGYATLGGWKGAAAGAVVGAIVVVTRGRILARRQAEQTQAAARAARALEERQAARFFKKEAQKRAKTTVEEAENAVQAGGTGTRSEARVESALQGLRNKSGAILVASSPAEREARAREVTGSILNEFGEDGCLAVELFVLHLELVTGELSPPLAPQADELFRVLRRALEVTGPSRGCRLAD
jgi:RHS repeat-associated protein